MSGFAFGSWSDGRPRPSLSVIRKIQESNCRDSDASVSLAFHVFRGGGGSEPTQKRNGKYQNEDEQSQQAKLGHASSKYARTLVRPRSTFCEGGRFQGNHKDAPNRGNQAHDKEWFGNQKMRADGDAHRMQNLHQHQHNEQLVQHQKCLGGNRPVTEALPEHLAGVCNRRECRYKKQHGKDGIDNHFGFAQIIAKVDAELLFGHLGSLVESRCFEPLQRQSTTISRLSKSENVDTWPITEKKFPRHCRRRRHLRHRHRQTSAARHGRVGKSQICPFRNTECNTETIMSNNCRKLYKIKAILQPPRSAPDCGRIVAATRPGIHSWIRTSYSGNSAR